MARPRKNSNIPSNAKDVKKEIVKEQKTEVSTKTEELKQPEEKIVEQSEAPETKEIEETICNSETKVEETIDIPMIDSPIEYVEEPNPNENNFKKVEVISDGEKKFHMNVSEVILRLKNQPQYKFLSKISLTKIATNIVNKKFYSK